MSERDEETVGITTTQPEEVGRISWDAEGPKAQPPSPRSESYDVTASERLRELYARGSEAELEVIHSPLLLLIADVVEAAERNQDKHWELRRSLSVLRDSLDVTSLEEETKQAHDALINQFFPEGEKE